MLYQLFDWANNASARLIIVAIANTLDLPERLLMPRVASRMVDFNIIILLLGSSTVVICPLHSSIDWDDLAFSSLFSAFD